MRFLDLIQADPVSFNVALAEKQQAYLKENGRDAFHKLYRENPQLYSELTSQRTQSFQLDETELEQLKQRKVLIKKTNKGASSFGQAYCDIYSNDLPVFVSSDSMLYALHRLYDDYLIHAETHTYRAELVQLCEGVLKAIQSISPQQAVDAGGVEFAASLARLEHLFLVPLAFLLLKRQVAPGMVFSCEDTGLVDRELVLAEQKRLASERKDAYNWNLSYDEREKIRQAEKKTKTDNITSGLWMSWDECEASECKLSSFMTHYYPPYSNHHGVTNDICSSAFLSTCFREFTMNDFQQPLVAVHTTRQAVLDTLGSLSNEQKVRVQLGVCETTSVLVSGAKGKPRGHYTKSWELSNYFRAFSWIFSSIHLSIDRAQLRPEEFQDAVAAIVTLVNVLDATVAPAMDRFTAFMRKIVGAPMAEATFFSFHRLLPFVRANVPPAATTTLTGQLTWIAANKAGLADKYNAMIGGGNVSSFGVLGQGTALDYVALGKLVDDEFRVDPGNVADDRRKFPRVLDVVHTVLGNDAVLPMLEHNMRPENVEVQQRDGFQYTAHLHKVREYCSKDESTDPESLYSQELRMLAALSADRKAIQTEAALQHLAPTFGSEAWGRKQANTQVGHYCELRHDNALYVKEFEGCSLQCWHPDLLVEPSPAFWYEFLTTVEQLKALFTQPTDEDKDSWETKILTKRLDALDRVTRDILLVVDAMMRNVAPDAAVVGRLKCICSVRHGGSGSSYTGWYIELFASGEEAFKFEPECSTLFSGVADVRGPGGVVHLGTGPAQLAYVIHNATAYVGPVYSAYEFITPHSQRLNDAEWASAYPNHKPIDFNMVLI